MLSASREASFGDRLRRHRLAAGLTQEALAERAGLSVHGIQKLERGVTRPYRDTLQRLLNALRLSADEEAELRSVAMTPRHTSTRATADGGARHNLPAAVTSFVGRERELAVVSAHLAGARLLS